MPRKIFGARGDGIKLQPGRRYRIRADYDSPEPDTLKSGAMGIIVLLYHPDDVRQWPTVDLADRDLQVDLTWLETMGWPRDAGEGEAQGAHQH
jgi:hypothetical protein